MIRGRHIKLEPARDSDWEKVYPMLSDERVWPALTADPAMVTPQGMLNLFAPQPSPGYAAVSFVARDRTTEAICGAINLTAIHWRDRNGVVSLMAADPNRNDAVWVCNEMAGLLLVYAFRHCGLNKVRALTWNPRLGAIYRRYGGSREGVLRQQVWHTGRWLDQEVWGVLREEWRDNAGDGE